MMQHAPITLSVSEEVRARVEAVRDEGKVEPELVAAVTNNGRFDRFHPTIAKPREVLQPGFLRSCSRFLLNNTVTKVKVNQAVVKRDIENLLKYSLVVYFMGGRLTHEAAFLWIRSL